MYDRFTFFLFFIIGFASVSIAHQANQRANVGKPDKVEVPDIGVEVPMTLRGAMPVVEVMVNGKGPFLFAIDTGGMGLARADVSLVKKLGLETVDTIQGSDGSGRNFVEMKVVKFDSLEIGDAKFTGVRAPSRDYNRSAALRRIDGMLGINLFDEHLVVIDYQKRKVRIVPGKLAEPDGKSIFEMDKNFPVPTISIPMGGKDVLFHLDTGNMGGFTIPSAMEGDLEFGQAPVKIGEARTVSNTFAIKQGKLKGNFRLGQFEFETPQFNVVEFPMKPNIGAEVLKHFSLTFDQKNKRVKFERDDDRPIKPESKARVGIAMRVTNGEMVVDHALPDSPAEKAGIKSGDEIVKLNGLEVLEMEREQIGAIMSGTRPITMTIRRDEETLEIVVKPEKQN